MDQRQSAVAIVADDSDMRRACLVVPFHQYDIANLHADNRHAKVLVKLALQSIAPRLSAIISPITHDNSASSHGMYDQADAINPESITPTMPPLGPYPLARLCNA
jgi:hypothetical protein